MWKCFLKRAVLKEDLLVPIKKDDNKKYGNFDFKKKLVFLTCLCCRGLVTSKQKAQKNLYYAHRTNSKKVN